MMGSKKRILLIVMILGVAMSSIACGTTEESPDSDSSTDSNNVSDEVMGLQEAFAEQPILLTSVGQSADVEMIKTLMDNAGLEYTMNKVATGDDLADTKTLVLAVGGSSKGLGAAGIDADEEVARTEDLVKIAKEKEVSIISMHIGGDSRRGELSDKFIGISCDDADFIIVAEGGNRDGIFTDIAIENEIPIESVTSIAEAIEPLKKAFK